MKFPKWLLMVFVTAFSVAAHAGKEVGNGGDGVIHNGRLTLLDFVENGIEEPYIDLTVRVPSDISTLLNRGNLPKEIPNNLLAAKLAEIYARRKSFAASSGRENWSPTCAYMEK